MKTRYALITALLCVVLVPALCPGGTVPKPAESVVESPDLTAKIRLVSKKYTNPKGVTCYSLQPIYTVTNMGMSTAKNFRVKLEWKWPSKPTWQACSFSANNSLSPGNNKEWGPSAVEEIHWCQGDTKKAGFRVTADDQSRVAERKEDNNTATIMFPNFKVKRK